MTTGTADVVLDYSKHRITDETLALLIALAPPGAARPQPVRQRIRTHAACGRLAPGHYVVLNPQGRRQGRLVEPSTPSHG